MQFIESNRGRVFIMNAWKLPALGLLFLGLQLACKAADCDGSFVLDSSHLTVNFNNQTRACYNWQVSYFSSGFSAANVVFESAPNGANGSVPGAWSTFSSLAGSNPSTATTQNTATFAGSFPWVRIRLASSSGTGAITGRMLGAQLTTATVFPSPFQASPAFGKFFIPQDSDFTWVDQGTVTESASADGASLILSAPLNSADTKVSKRCATIPAAPWTVTAAFITPLTTNSLYGGIALQQTGNAITTEFLKIDPQGNNSFVRFSVQCTADTVASCNQNQHNSGIGWNGAAASVFWERVWDNGTTNRAYETSTNGIDWIPLSNYSTVRGDLAAYGNITPNQACWMLNQSSNDNLYSYRLVSWKVCGAVSTSVC